MQEAALPDVPLFPQIRKHMCALLYTRCFSARLQTNSGPRGENTSHFWPHNSSTSTPMCYKAVSLRRACCILHGCKMFQRPCRTCQTWSTQSLASVAKLPVGVGDSQARPCALSLPLVHAIVKARSARLAEQRGARQRTEEHRETQRMEQSGWGGTCKGSPDPVRSTGPLAHPH